MNLTTPPPAELPVVKRLNISELVEAVRGELERVDVRRQASKREALFQLSKLEIEIQFVVAVDETIKGGFDLKVVSVGGERGGSTENTQKVTITYDVVQSSKPVMGSRGFPSPKADVVEEIEPLR